MTKTFSYPISGVSVYLESTDETEDYIDRSVEYTANNDELLEAVANIVCEEFLLQGLYKTIKPQFNVN